MIVSFFDSVNRRVPLGRSTVNTPIFGAIGTTLNQRRVKNVKCDNPPLRARETRRIAKKSRIYGKKRQSSGASIRIFTGESKRYAAKSRLSGQKSKSRDLEIRFFDEEIMVYIAEILIDAADILISVERRGSSAQKTGGSSPETRSSAAKKAN